MNSLKLKNAQIKSISDNISPAMKTQTPDHEELRESTCLQQCFCYPYSLNFLSKLCNFLSFFTMGMRIFQRVDPGNKVEVSPQIQRFLTFYKIEY